MSQSGSERRQWPRIPAAALGHITASVVAGPAVRLVNLSRGGALMEVASRFPMRSRVRLKLTLATGEVTVAEGLVAWARVAAIVDKQVNYLVAIIFDTPIPDLGGLDAAPLQESALPVVILEAPAVQEAAAPRDNLSQFPAPVVRVPEPARTIDAWTDTPEQVVSLDSALAAAEDPKSSDAAIGELAAANDALVAQLAAADAARTALRDDLEGERRTREDERARLVQDIAAAAANVEALQATLAAREQEHAEALAEQQARVEAGQSGLSAREQEHAHLLTQLTEHQARYEALQSSLAMRERDHDRAVAELVQHQARCEELQAALAAREDDRARAAAELTEQQARFEALQASLGAREQEHARAVDELAVQQERYDALQSSFAAREQEHVRAIAEVATLRNQLEALESALAVREQEHAAALAEQKAGYDALTAELLQASLDQQAEYQVMLEERAAEREADRLRGEANTLAFARLHEEATQEREQLELRYHDVQARLEAAQSLCAAQEARDRDLRRELEKLAAMVTTLVGSPSLDRDQAVA